MSELPKGWADAELGDTVVPIETDDPRKKPESHFVYVDIGAIDNKTQRIVESRSLSGAEAPSRARRVIRNGDVLFSTVRTYLKNIAIVPPELDGQITSTGIAVLRASEAVDARYIFNLVRSDEFIRSVSLKQDGTLYPAITDNDLLTHKIKLPPLAEQKRIVAKLDALATKSARARTELARIDTLVSRYKQAVLTKAFSGELTPDIRKPSSDQILAKITDPFTHTQVAPATWEQHVFSEVCRIVGGSQPPKSTFAYAPQEDHVRLVQIRDYKSDAKATYIPRELARRFCSATDIMIGRYGPPIFQILRGIEGAYNVALMKAEPTKAVDQEFLYWYLHHPILFRYVEIDSKRTAGQDGVNKAHLERWPILLPPLNEQREIVRRLEFAFQKIDRLAVEAKRALELVGKLDEAILAKAFRGELVPQDPHDEPASVLLERIKAERAAAPKAKRGRGKKA